MQTQVTIYRGYDIEKGDDGTFSWTDERGFVHPGELNGPFVSEDECMSSIDAYKRNMRTANGGAA